MTTTIVINRTALNCELRNGGLFAAWTTHGDDVSEIIKSVWSLEQEVIRLVKAGMEKE